ncbi:ead/Ea22-like family protein [Escherichia coli]|uniref:ead/Ea22-like family protein n=1 Tax=Escherichia coli TaxID=562 RepID=UPI0005C515CD|nr:ead/Ea22-like family protein [Escherichia coli]QIL99843.1 ead/Ea22-like family protein [Escherichia coli]UWD24271.1 ead/Ea22-like family protein [Escherichia coli]
MTDITELAQSLKAAAEKATPGRWEYYPGNTSIEYNVDSMDEDQGSIVYVDSGDFTQAQTDRNGEFIALANPASILALVESLEKAQQVDEELCKLLPPGVEYMDPPDGGDVTPLEGVRRMVADYRQRIAELESRTVTVKQGEVLVTVSGFTGSGKSAIAGEIEIAMKAIGVLVTWANGDSEKRMTGADWLTAIEMYKPTVRIVEENIPRAAGIKVEAE